MTTFLLDANVLIALAVAEHTEHDRATRWATGVDSFALCPVVEGALLRFVVRLGANVSDGLRLCEAIQRRPGFEFWADELSYTAVPLGHVIGHRQLTDAYLAGLAAHRGGLLATMDEGLAASLPGATHLLPR